MNNLIGMKIKINGFCRCYGDDVMIYNPRTNGGVIISDECRIVRNLIARRDSKETVTTLIREFDIKDVQTIERDVYAVMQTIASVGLGTLEGFSEGPIKDNLERDNKESTLEDGKNTVAAQFYDMTNLLPELHIDLTNACSERCIHCYVPQGQHDFLPYEVCVKALREFRGQQGLTVQLSGGECMLHPDFAKICRMCRELDLNFIVLSNLTLCDEGSVGLLKETKPQFVNVSLYSMDEKEHDAITQVSGSWRKTRMAIDALQTAGVAVRLATPLLKANQNAYPALKQFAKERRVHLIPDCDIIPRCGRDCSNLNYACTPEEVERVLMKDKAFWDRGYGKNPNLGPEDKVCDIGQLLRLNSKGFYYPCGGMHEYVLGDAREVTLTEVWRGEKMNYLRGLKNKDFPKCVGCEHRAFCKVCPAFNFNATGSLFETISAKCAVSSVRHKVYGGE